MAVSIRRCWPAARCSRWAKRWRWRGNFRHGGMAWRRASSRRGAGPAELGEGAAAEPGGQLDEVQERHHLGAVLVGRGDAHGDDAAVGLAPGRDDGDDLAEDVERVARPHRAAPGQVVDLQPAHRRVAARRLVAKVAHHQRGDMPAAGDDAAEAAARRRHGIEVHRLRIIGGGEADDVGLGHGNRAAVPVLADGEIVEKQGWSPRSFGHFLTVTHTETGATNLPGAGLPTSIRSAVASSPVSSVNEIQGLGMRPKVIFWMGWPVAEFMMVAITAMARPVAAARRACPARQWCAARFAQRNRWRAGDGGTLRRYQGMMIAVTTLLALAVQASAPQVVPRRATPDEILARVVACGVKRGDALVRDDAALQEEVVAERDGVALSDVQLDCLAKAATETYWFLQIDAATQARNQPIDSKAGETASKE